MRRNAQAIIDLDALRHNFQRVKQFAPNSHVMAVIKADAYGHGLIQSAQALNQADAFAVACLQEAVTLRNAGITQAITIFQGFQDVDQLQQMAALNLTPVIHQQWQLDMLEQQPVDLGIWLKVNSGMGRLGLQPEEVVAAWSRLVQNPGIREIGLFSHFANADVPDHPSNQIQIDCFQSLANTLDAQTSLANSAGLIAFSQAHGDWVRPGIMLYGSSPLADRSAQELGLKPVMQLQAPLIAINHLRKNDSIGYGSLWQCPEDMPVGSVAIGYGDGYPRHARTGTPVWINGRQSQVLGRVSMDTISIDLRGIDNPRCGDEVVLWGREVTVDDVARNADTIAYELLCNLARSRID